MPGSRPPKKSELSPDHWSTDRILPEGFAPMLPASASGPLASPDFAYEVRWDGLRVLVGLEGDRLVARTGAGQDVEPWFPELRRLRAAAAPLWVLFDGEIVAFEEGRPSRNGLQRRMAGPLTPPLSGQSPAAPVAFIAYDILRIGDSWLLDVGWQERRDILARTLQPSERILIPPVMRTGERAAARAAELGLEGIIAKRMRGRYLPGERTREWLNIRPTETLDVVIGGWTSAQDDPGAFRGVLVGLWGPDGLRYLGHAPIPPTGPASAELEAKLSPLAAGSCPFEAEPPVNAPTHWAQPRVAARVRFHGWTAAGRLRSPAFLETLDQPAADPRLPSWYASRYQEAPEDEDQ